MRSKRCRVWVLIGAIVCFLAVFGNVRQRTQVTVLTADGVDSTSYKDLDNGAPCESIRDKKFQTIHMLHAWPLFRPILFQHINVGKDFGNTVSKYWAARALAELGGYHYVGLFTGSFPSYISHLPKFVTASSPPRPAQLHRLLCTCGNFPDSIEDLHECKYGYAGIVDSIRRDTRMAVQDYIQKTYSDNHHHDNHEMIQQQALGHFYGQHDWLIYDRCQILEHAAHGFATLSLYDALPINTNYNYTVYSLSGRKEGLPFCDELHQIRNDYITSRNPRVTIVELEQLPDRTADFGRMVFSPNLVIPSAGSSWALFAALANAGRVVTVKFKPDHDDPSIFPDNFEVMLNQTVLYNPAFKPQSAKLLGFNDSQVALTPQGKQRLFECYKHC